MGRNKQLAKNISYVMIGNIGSKLMGFIMLPFYTRWLSPSDYGTVDMINVFAMLLLNVVACDVSDAIFVFPNGETKDRIKRFFSTGLFFQLLCSILCAVLFFLLSRLHCNYFFFENIWFIYGILISNLFQKYAQDFCRGLNKMSVFSFTGIIQTFSIAVFSILFIPSNGVWGYVLAIIFSNIITASFSFIYSASYNYVSLKSVHIIELKEMLHYSIPLIPTAVLWWFVSGLNRPLLEEYVGVYSIGLLAVSMKLPTIMSTIYNFFQQAWLISVLQECRKSDFSIYFNKTYKMIMIIQTFICLMIIISSESFISVMTTEEYFQAWKFIPIIALGIIFSNTTAFIGTLFSAFKVTKYTFYTAVAGGVTAILLNFLLIPFYGIWGACFAILCSQIVSSSTRAFFANKFVTFKNEKFLLKQLTILIPCYLMSLYLNSWILIIGYFFNLIVFIIFNKKDLKYILIILNQKIRRRK